MQLILLENVRGLGQLGDKVNVKPGYGRNYLVPQGKATAATAANLAEFEARRAEYEARASEQLEGANARAAQFADGEVTISANASAEGKLYGSIGPREIADAFTAKGLKLAKNEVILAEGPIRNVGEHEAHLALHADVQTTVKVIVTAIV
ncbi:MAG TPA: 50S ribosomal protein L9 [Rhodanobacteraceae bacterium]|nr:50S ribosomal protein L9 [Rhodanobacteraceae bacterium]